ncbi:endonuclease domain-containing protein [Microbacterium esteraromaticum]|uniref:endonuclease domain-containing protein n=1 Tax=Microbacterium esteraromaticum TaxID=57043 RepID=UPI002367A909|nr:endonuclease domain-containing protein [Microbacterium esteraromaticum]WDH80177.1 endonuclease domain-containing protein [Microbacterium esteraromaticum]
MVTRQFCDICKQPERAMRNGVVKLLALDHDHATGAWRGVLCQRCNQAIGMFRDNPQLLRLAADYVENPPGLLILE